MDQPTAEDALRRARAPRRRVDGQARWPDGGRGPAAKVTFEWHDSGAHLVERGTVEMPEAPDSISIIGCDAANGTYFQLYSDERGVCRVYEMSIGNGEWKLWREGEPFSQRFTDLQRRREHDHRTLGDRRRRHRLHDRLRPHLPQVDT